MELEYALLIGIFTAVFSFPFYQMIVMCIVLQPGRSALSGSSVKRNKRGGITRPDQSLLPVKIHGEHCGLRIMVLRLWSPVHLLKLATPV